MRLGDAAREQAGAGAEVEHAPHRAAGERERADRGAVEVVVRRDQPAAEGVVRRRVRVEDLGCGAVAHRRRVPGRRLSRRRPARTTGNPR
jgi:hypothetical protein